MLLPMRGPLKLPLTIFAVENRPSPEHIKSESAKRFYDGYRQNAPDKKVYDLSQNPDHRQRTETVDGALCTLTTSSNLW